MAGWDWLGSFGTTTADEVAKGAGSGLLGWLNNGDNLRGLGSLVSGVGGAWTGLEQSKQAKAMLNLQKSAYDDEKKRRDAAQLAINSAWSTTPTPMASLPLGGA